MIFLFLFILFAFLITKAPSRRHLLFCLLAIYLVVSPKIAIPFGSYNNLRLMIFLVIYLQNSSQLNRFVAKLVHIGSFNTLFVWIIYLIFSVLVVSQNFEFSSVYEPLGTLIYFILFTYYVQHYSRAKIRTLLYYLLFAYMLNMYGRLPYILGVDSLPFVIQITRHQTAGASGMYSLPILFFLLSETGKTLNRVLIWIYVLLSAVVVYLASARTPSLGYAVIFATYKRSAGRFAMLAALFVLIIFFVTKSEYAEFANERAMKLIYSDPTASAPSEVEFRKQNIQYGLESFRENPLLGVGYTNWQSIYESRSSILDYTLSAHNGYIKILSETGLIGAVLFLLTVIMNLWGMPFKLEKGYGKKLFYTAAVLTMSVFIYSMGGDAFYRRSIYIFLAMALGAKLRIQQENQRPEPLPATSDPPSSSTGRPSVQGS